MVTGETFPCFKCHVKSQFREKNRYFLLRKFSSLVLPSNAMMLQHLVVQFSLYNLFSGRSLEVKNERKFHFLALKEVAVAYERWSLTRGSKFIDMTFGILESWSLRRDGRNRRFDCIHVIMSLLVCRQTNNRRPHVKFAK